MEYHKFTNNWVVLLLFYYSSNTSKLKKILKFLYGKICVLYRDMNNLAFTFMYTNTFLTVSINVDLNQSHKYRSLSTKLSLMMQNRDFI